MMRIVGYVVLVVSCLLFLLIPVMPFLGFSKTKVAGITTGLIIAGEVLFYTSIFILGKSFYAKIKGKLMFWKAKPDKNSTNL